MKKIDIKNNQYTDRSNESLVKYFEMIRVYKPLTREDEVMLAKKIQDGDHKAFETFFNANLRFVVSIAKNYQECGLDIMDIIQNGNIGLMNAINKYTDYENYRFSTFAMSYIRKGIIDGLEECGHIIRNNHRTLTVANIVKKTIKKLTNINGEEPSIDEVADYLGIDYDDVVEVLNTRQKVQSMDEAMGTEDDDTFGDFIAGDISTDACMVAEDRQQAIEIILSKLTQREKTIISMYFGLGDGIETSIDCIADHMGLTNERVRQLYKSGLKKLQENPKVMEMISGIL